MRPARPNGPGNYGGGGSGGSATRIRFADFGGLVNPNDIVSAAVDVSNGVKITLKNSAASRDLPHTGACWVRAGAYDQSGNLLGVAGASWTPSLKRPDALIQERAKTGSDPILIRVGVLWMDTASPATCTEGFGYYLDYNATTLRRVGIVRVTGAGTWSAASTTTATGVNTHSGCLGTSMAGSIGALQACCALGTDVNGDPFAPIGLNKATHTASTISLTAGVGWYTGLWTGWTATGGVDGVSVTVDPMYWLSQTPGRG